MFVYFNIGGVLRKTRTMRVYFIWTIYKNYYYNMQIAQADKTSKKIIKKTRTTTTKLLKFLKKERMKAICINKKKRYFTVFLY